MNIAVRDARARVKSLQCFNENNSCSSSKPEQINSYSNKCGSSGTNQVKFTTFGKNIENEADLVSEVKTLLKPECSLYEPLAPSDERSNKSHHGVAHAACHRIVEAGEIRTKPSPPRMKRRKKPTPLMPEGKATLRANKLTAPGGRISEKIMEEEIEECLGKILSDQQSKHKYVDEKEKQEKISKDTTAREYKDEEKTQSIFDEISDLKLPLDDLKNSTIYNRRRFSLQEAGGCVAAEKLISPDEESISPVDSEKSSSDTSGEDGEGKESGYVTLEEVQTNSKSGMEEPERDFSSSVKTCNRPTQRSASEVKSPRCVVTFKDTKSPSTLKSPKELKSPRNLKSPKDYDTSLFKFTFTVRLGNKSSNSQSVSVADKESDSATPSKDVQLISPSDITLLNVDVEKSKPKSSKQNKDPTIQSPNDFDEVDGAIAFKNFQTSLLKFPGKFLKSNEGTLKKSVKESNNNSNYTTDVLVTENSYKKKNDLNEDDDDFCITESSDSMMTQSLTDDGMDICGFHDRLQRRHSSLEDYLDFIPQNKTVQNKDVASNAQSEILDFDNATYLKSGSDSSKSWELCKNNRVPSANCSNMKEKGKGLNQHGCIETDRKRMVVSDIAPHSKPRTGGADLEPAGHGDVVTHMSWDEVVKEAQQLGIPLRAPKARPERYMGLQRSSSFDSITTERDDHKELIHLNKGMNMMTMSSRPQRLRIPDSNRLVTSMRESSEADRQRKSLKDMFKIQKIFHRLAKTPGCPRSSWDEEEVACRKKGPDSRSVPPSRSAHHNLAAVAGSAASAAVAAAHNCKQHVPRHQHQTVTSPACSSNSSNSCRCRHNKIVKTAVINCAHVRQQKSFDDLDGAITTMVRKKPLTAINCDVEKAEIHGRKRIASKSTITSPITPCTPGILIDSPDAVGSNSLSGSSGHSSVSGQGQVTSRLRNGTSSGQSAESNRKEFIESLDQLQSCAWYWGALGLNDAEARLSQKPDGTFLVRDSSDDRYILSLSFRSLNSTHHTRIEHYKGNFSFYCQPLVSGSPRGGTIVEFIEDCMRQCKGGKCLYYLRPRGPGLPPAPVQLLYPLSRYRCMHSLKHLCKFSILNHVRLDLIDRLPISPRLKEYVKENQDCSAA